MPDKLFELGDVRRHRVRRKRDAVPIENCRIERKGLANGEESLSQAQPRLIRGRVGPEERRELVTQVSLLRMHRKIRQQHPSLLPRDRHRRPRIGTGLEAPQERQPELRHVGGKIALSPPLPPPPSGMNTSSCNGTVTAACYSSGSREATYQPSVGGGYGKPPNVPGTIQPVGRWRTRGRGHGSVHQRGPGSCAHAHEKTEDS